VGRRHAAGIFAHFIIRPACSGTTGAFVESAAGTSLVKRVK
jgi:activator of 2-hydroxyglutaryl-CoA dehydratase